MGGERPGAFLAHRAPTMKRTGRAPMLALVRPLNEALLRARVPGAQDQCGYPSQRGKASKLGKKDHIYSGAHSTPALGDRLDCL